jgi:hypothetical protein
MLGRNLPSSMTIPSSQARFIALASVIVLYALASNLLLHTGDELMLIEGNYSSGGFHYYYNWTTAIIQPWLWPLYWITESSGLLEPHGTVRASLVSGTISTLILISITFCITRSRPSIYLPLLAVFGCFAMIGVAHAAKDVWDIHSHNLNIPIKQEAQQGAPSNGGQRPSLNSGFHLRRG